MKRFWNGFEHRLHTWFKEKGWQDRRFLISVSGGVDSMVLLSSVAVVLNKENIAVMHLHHGDSSGKEQNDFRDRAQFLVEQFCHSQRIRFFIQKSEKPLSSEELMRDFRYQYLQQCCKLEGFDFVILGHHQEDQVESQLLHLMRGCGLQGLVGMKEVNGNLLRPFLSISKQQIYAYAKEKELPFIEDPSNESIKYLRNWLRKTWIPALDETSGGLKQSFMNSFLQISRELQAPSSDKIFDIEEGIPRQSFVAASKDEKKKMIYRYLIGLEVDDIRQGQIEEILKRLDKGQKELIFRMSHTEWVANAQYIVARRKP